MTITHAHQTRTAPTDRGAPAFEAFTILRVGFTVAPILFGLDKFLGWLVNWDLYLAPAIDDLVPGTAHQAMLAAGDDLDHAGVVVAVRPRFGGYLVAAWLAGIIVNLLILGDHYDVALRDLGLLLAALALARLARGVDVTEP